MVWDKNVKHALFISLQLSSHLVNSITLSDLDGSNGFEIDGDSLNDNLGNSVSSAGDFNGDGYDDIIIGAPQSDSGTGSSYIIFGTSADLRTNPVRVSGLDGTNGITIFGEQHQDLSGYSVAGGFDFNNDGFGDVIIGAPHGAPTVAGVSYIIYGTDAIGSGVIYLSELKGIDGFALYGVNASDGSGYSVSSLGDFNNDGYDDVIIGADKGNMGTGEAYVVYGGEDVAQAGVLGYFSLQHLDGLNGFVIRGIRESDKCGCSVSGAGDVNGDGFNDIIIGASGVDNGDTTDTGAAYIVYGGEDVSQISTNGVLRLDELDESKGAVLLGISLKDYAGTSVSGAGDFNGDGYDDIIIGAPEASSNNGYSFIVYGGGDTFLDSDDRSLTFPLSSLNGINGFILEGDLKSASGSCVRGGSDVNKDGYDDVIIGAPTWTNEDYTVMCFYVPRAQEFFFQFINRLFHSFMLLLLSLLLIFDSKFSSVCIC
jgi:hypothetical protein